MRLLAISDLHLDHAENREAIEAIGDHPDDWLLLAGDVSHDPQDLVWCLDRLVDRFARVAWVPGNHDLWTFRGDARPDLLGQDRYQHLVEICRQRSVLTPEDPYAELAIEGQAYVVAPLFLLYDYSFRPPEVPASEAVRWARADGVLCSDEFYLSPAPHRSRADWCAARCELTAARLGEVPARVRMVLVNHFPLRHDLIRIRIPRFSIWCGTRLTEDWHRRFNVEAVVSGHLHVPSTRWRDGVRFEEVSLGYPAQWDRQRGIGSYLRQILPERR